MKTLKKIISLFHYDKMKHVLMISMILGVNLIVYEIYSLSHKANAFFDEQSVQFNSTKVITNRIPEILDKVDQNLVSSNDTIKESKIAITKVEKVTDTTNTQIASIGQGIRSLEDEGTHQLKQNGDLVASNLENTKAITKNIESITKNADTKINKILDDGTTYLETANPKLQAILDNFQEITIDAKGEVKGLKPIEDNLTSTTSNLNGIASNLNGITKDGKDLADKIVHPPPCKSAGCIIKNYVLSPIYNGLKIGGYAIKYL